MNEVFIILNNEYSFVNLIFDNFRNEFIFHDRYYNFQFLDKNRLKIYNKNESYILNTVDSYIFSNKADSLNNYKLISLNHNEWFDQALLLFKNNQIIRIKDRNQYGQFELINDTLDIYWNHWGKETFKYFDINIYHHESMIDYLNKNDIFVFMHVCNLNDGVKIFKKQLERVMNSKIYNDIKKIYVCWVGKYNNEVKTNSKIEVKVLSDDITNYEFLTINKIKEVINHYDKEYKVLYIHNKGTNKSGNSNVIDSWKELMEYFLIDEGLYCVKGLEYFDTIGCNIINQSDNEDSKINPQHAYHYSGNFWWSKSSYIKSLPFLQIEENNEYRKKKRYQCENWILSNINNKNIGIIYQDNTNIHPYHRFVFDIYKNKKLFIKKLNN